MPNFQFFFNSAMLGIGLAMDAFSVSLANGLSDPLMKTKKQVGIAGTFAFFQSVMPMLGWICVHTVLQYFTKFELAIPWIALVLLGFIGGKMLYDGVKNKEEEQKAGVGLVALLVQGVATSIDALSVGFTIAEYIIWHALLACLIIGIITFGICLLGLYFGKKFGTKLAGKANILGGVILIAIGLEIFISGII